MSDTKTATGVCHEITERGEWTTFNVDVGSQYPVRISTKLQPLIELGRAANKAGGVYDWTYKESEGNVNPSTGKPFTNRYLEGVTPHEDGQGPSRPPILGGDKDRLIVRQTCLKAAAAMYGGSPEGKVGEVDWPLEVIKAAGRFENWVYRDLEPPPFEEEQVPALSAHDDGIPFDGQ